jgi:hypothetical protein
MVFISEESEFNTKKDIIKKFVNRENPLKIMADEYRDLEILMQHGDVASDFYELDHFVLNYYGIGGKGKSSLIYNSTFALQNRQISLDITR